MGLLLTVTGTTVPIIALALTQSMWIYAVAQGLSGIFASTFTITFAYIADVVPKVPTVCLVPKKLNPPVGRGRCAGQGLALALGLGDLQLQVGDGSKLPFLISSDLNSKPDLQLRP